MKKAILSLILVPYLSQAVVQMPRPVGARPSCGLPDTTADDGIIEAKHTLDISRLKEAELLRLPVLMKQQLIIAAFNPSPKLRFDNRTLLKAVELLKDSSEAGDLDVTDFKFGTKVFTYVRSYPGGNEGGTIFAYGTAQMLAGVGDQDIVCVK
jgi:hypothetical protein